MRKILTIISGLLIVLGVHAQEKDTIQVQKIGDKYFVIMDHKDPDTTKYVPVDYHKKFDSHFMVVGLTTVGFIQNWTTTNSVKNGIVNQKTKTNALGDADNFEFSPMLLWRHGDKVLLEFEPSFTAGGLGVNWADVSYFLAPGVIVRAGYFVLPFGTYSKRLAAGWINKFGYDPVGATMNPVGSDWGIELSGGAQAGKMKINYDIALANGFSHSSTDGSLYNPGIVDDNLAKTVCGRFGWLPISNSSLEIGVSGLYGRVDTGASKKVSTMMGAIDVQYIYAKNPIQITFKGQYNMAYVTNFTYANPNTDTTTAISPTYSFKNLSQGYYAMLAFRPVVQGTKFKNVLRNFELAGRFSQYDNATGAIWENHTRQIDVALDYWINWRTVIKLCYENLLVSNPLNSNIGLNDNKALSHILQVQFSVQL
jgi:hypothetical protein